jgi:hypothetical protein
MDMQAITQRPAPFPQVLMSQPGAMNVQPPQPSLNNIADENEALVKRLDAMLSSARILADQMLGGSTGSAVNRGDTPRPLGVVPRIRDSQRECFQLIDQIETQFQRLFSSI